jgi:XTP/dITP diphosphohydrolase
MPHQPRHAPAGDERPAFDERPGLLVATHNGGKLSEFKRLLSDLPLRLYGLGDFPPAAEAVEDGQTFAENASIKARHYFLQIGLLTLADDSGLEVEALGGEPGVRSARYAGPDATDDARVRLLLHTLDAIGDAERRARFVCVLALVGPPGEYVRTFYGTCGGRIAAKPSGSGGFGYDPVFIPDGYTQTFGELPSNVKNRISHRARALAALRAYIEDRFKGV